MLVVGITKI